MSTVDIRKAVPSDIGTIMGFIKKLAAYEKMSDLVVGDEKLLENEIFVKGRADVLIASIDGTDVGFALFFYNFSTFLGRSGIYLEDLFVDEGSRGHGVGKALLTRLASIAVERGCGRLEWSCLDWNQPSIDFYLSLGAVPLKDWTVYRLDGETLANAAKGGKRLAK